MATVIAERSNPELRTPMERRDAPSSMAFNRSLVYALFFASGISGLMYQVVWLRMLARMMGVTIHATSAVLAAFMGGLALGSFALGRYIDKRKDPLRVYAVLEVMVGVAALLVPFILAGTLPLYRTTYHMVGGEGASVVRVIFAMAALLIPTTIMGGTLPVLTAYMTRSQGSFGKSFSALYGLNTLGAVVGVLFSGFVTLGALGEWWTMIIGATLNFIVAGLAYWFYLRERTQEEVGRIQPAVTSTAQISTYSETVRKVVLIAFALSGFTALAYEVVWMRQLILFLRTSIYAFSGMLAVFLIGVALGSLVMNRLADKLKAPLFTFAMLELGVAVISLINLHLFKPLDSDLARAALGWSNVAWATFIVVLPLTFMFGLIAPIALMCYAKSVSKAGSSVGGLYSANTAGNILGAVLAGFVLIPQIGATRTVLWLALGNAAIGIVLLVLETRKSTAVRLGIGALALPVIALLATSIVGKTDPFLGAIEQRIDERMGTTWMPDSNATLPKSHKIYFHKEGREGTLTAFEINRFKQLWINGQGMTFQNTETKMMAYLPLAMSKNPKNFLAIAFGMGTTVRSADRAEKNLYPGLDITAVDLVPETFEAYKFYHEDGPQILAQPNVHPVVNDGRNHLLLSPKLYDVITVDPAPPIYSAGTVNLYTREFFELAKSRLTDTGVFCLWFPQGTKIEVHSILRTFHTVFPNAAIFSGSHNNGYYLFGPKNDLDWNHFQTELAKVYQNPNTLADATEFDASASSVDLVNKTLMWRGAELDRFNELGVVITDNFPFTEFPIWRYVKDGIRVWHPRAIWLPIEQRT